MKKKYLDFAYISIFIILLISVFFFNNCISIKYSNDVNINNNETKLDNNDDNENNVSNNINDTENNASSNIDDTANSNQNNNTILDNNINNETSNGNNVTKPSITTNDSTISNNTSNNTITKPIINTPSVISPKPSTTPKPTVTPKPSATPTPVPTSTPKPTVIPTPTESPKPTVVPTPTPSTTPTPTPVEKTMKEENQDLINEIKNTYGYQISYNDEDFWYGGVEATQLTDEELANKSLKLIKEASSELPSGFFKTFQGYNGYRIIMYAHIEGAAGVTSYEFGDDNCIAIDVNTSYLKRVFFHETFHVIEQYIRYKTYGSSFPFDDWSSYNPSGFNYGSSGMQYTVYDLNSSYSFDNPENIAFVSEYSKTNDREDRAELFADLMFRPFKKNYMSSGFAVNEKAKKMATILRNYFPNVAGSRIESYITW